MIAMTKACVNISSKIVAIGPALTDLMFELDDNVYRKLLSRLNVKAGDWIEIQSIEEFHDLYSYVHDNCSNSPKGIYINGILSAGSSLLGTLSAMPKKLRLQSSLVTSCATSKEKLSLLSHSIFQKVVKQLNINYWGIKEKGFNAIGMIFSSPNIPDRLLAMYQGVSHHLSINSNIIQAEYLLVSAFELTGGEITNSINELICSNKYKVILGLGNYLILSANLLNMIKRYLKNGLIYCIAGNEAEFKTLLHCNKLKTIRSYSLLENVPYILITLGEKGMVGIFKDKEIFQGARHVNNIINTSGCGDISLGIFISGVIYQMEPVLILRNAVYYSSLILQRSSNVFYEGIENAIE